MLSSQIGDLIESLKSASKADALASPDEPTISINEIIKKAGIFYERIRYSIDYREEHTIRRAAIERILNRNLIFSRGSQISRILIEELIRAGYIDNHKIPERYIGIVQGTIDRFLLLERLLSERGASDSKIKKRILSLTATELEILFFDDLIERLITKAFTDTIKKQVRIPATGLAPEQESIQVYLAARRAVLRSDEQSLSYSLWLRFVPGWKDIKSNEEIEKIAANFQDINTSITENLQGKLGWYLVSKFKNYGIYFSVLREIIVRYGTQSERIFSDQKLLDEEITSVLENHYKKENAKTRKSSIRAIIYIFFTKMIFGVSLELPYDLFFHNSIQYLALGSNILFHPLLLFAITFAIKPLGKKNTALAINGIHSIVYEDNQKVTHVKMQGYNNLIGFAFFIMYSIIFLISFGVVVYILKKLDFNIVSIAIFMFFLTLVSYFGIRIRFNAKRWLVISGEEGTWAFLWNLFALPVIEVGRWLNKKFSSINIFVFIMDFIIENPFKLILKISDSFVSFVKEKREQI